MKKILDIILCLCILYTGYTIVCADDPVYLNQTVIVDEGDTLWSIATEHLGHKEDIREVVFRICETNKIADSNIYPGQVLQVPVLQQEKDQGLKVANR